MGARSLPELPIRLMLETGVHAHLLLGGVRGQGPHGCATAPDLLHHRVLTVRDLRW